MSAYLLEYNCLGFEIRDADEDIAGFREGRDDGQARTVGALSEQLLVEGETGSRKGAERGDKPALRDGGRHWCSWMRVLRTAVAR